MLVGIPIKPSQFPLQLGNLLFTAGIGTVPFRFEDGHLSWSTTKSSPQPLTHLVFTEGLPGSPDSEFSYYSAIRPAAKSEPFLRESGLFSSAMRYGMSIATDKSQTSYERSTGAIRIAGNGNGKPPKEASLQNSMDYVKAAFAISANQDEGSRVAMAGYLFSAAMMFMESGFPISAAISSEISADLFGTSEPTMLHRPELFSQGESRARQFAAAAWRVAASMENLDGPSLFFLSRGIANAWHDSGYEEMESLLSLSADRKLGDSEMAEAGMEILRRAFFSASRSQQKPWERIGDDIQVGTSYLMAKGHSPLDVGLARDLMFSAKQLSR